MFSIADRINALSKLGEWMVDVGNRWPMFYNEHEQLLVTCLKERYIFNPYHTESMVLKALKIWAEKLSLTSLKSFLDRYPELNTNQAAYHVASISTEDIPLSGFQDLICILLAGHHYYCRNHNHSQDLLELLTKQLISIEPKFSGFIHWCASFPKSTDAYLISVKSGNPTLSEYLGKKQSLIRNKRISVAVVGSKDRIEDFELLGNDIFDFFGHSSYNVRKIYIPKQFAFKDFFEPIESFSFVYNHNRYANNYDYQKSVLLLELQPFLDNGFLILQESSKMTVPMGCVYYEYYENLEELMTRLQEDNVHIQQIVTNFETSNSVKFGETFDYPLWNFEDQKDTIKFLTNLNTVNKTLD